MQKEIGGVLQFAMGYCCLADCDGRDSGPGDAPKGVSPGLGIPPIAIFNMFSFFVFVALPPSSAARSQVDQGEEIPFTKMKYKMTLMQQFKCTKMVSHTLQPNCDAQDTAICRQVNQKGHTSQ